jgi:hypothetical protein
MKTGPKDYLKLGDHNAICPVCGFKYKASEMKTRWDGVKVCPTDWEIRHPQDLIRVPKDDGSVAWSYPPGPAKDTDGATIAEGAPKFVTFGPADPDSL